MRSICADQAAFELIQRVADRVEVGVELIASVAVNDAVDDVAMLDGHTMAHEASQGEASKEDAVLIHFGEHVVGRYFTEYEAREVLASLVTAIDKENLYFEFPRSLNQDTLERKRDARTKRKGGS